MSEELNQKELTLDDIIADLQGFGIEELESPVKITSKGKTVEIQLGNIPTDDELESLLASEEFKGHQWIMRVKIEILIRSITRINGVEIRGNRDEFVMDPVSGTEKTLLAALRNMAYGWGQPVIALLWKILMVHTQKIEDRLFESMPDAQIMTDVERRLITQAMEEIQEAQRQVYTDAAKELLLPEETETTDKE